MRFVKLRSALVLLVTVAGFAVARGQESGPEYWYPIEPFRIEVDTRNPEIRALLERWERIGNEAQSISNGFAGMYVKSGYRGWLLRWAPGAGFVYVFHYEGLSIIDFSYGKVEVTSGEIRFIPERDMRETYRGQKLQTPLSWIAIQAPQLRFMIPADEIADFGQYVAGLSNYNDFNGPCCEFDPFFVAPRAMGEVADVAAITVPDKYQRFMRPPITGRIVSVGRRRVVKDYGLEGKFFSQSFLDKSSLTPIKINAGRIHGLKKNMLLRFAGDQSDVPDQFIQVTSVGRQTATAVVIRGVDDGNQESYIVNPHESDKRISFPPIRPGLRVTTSPILKN